MTTPFDQLLALKQERQHFAHAHDKLLSRHEAADFLGVKPATLAIWHCNKRYPLPVVKVGKLAKYRLSDLQAFIDSNAQ